MANKIKLFNKSGYDWKYSTVGGVTRVNIETGEDIAHLGELDHKLWTVLSCPVNGLEFDSRTLTLMDSDNDGRIRVAEVVGASRWLTNVLVDMNYLLDAKDTIDFSNILTNTDEGMKVLEAARMILGKLGLEKESIKLSDVTKYMEVYEEKCKAEYVADETPFEPPYGDKSDDAAKAVEAVRAKIADYFLRCKLVGFDADAAKALDVQVEKIEAISGSNLIDNVAEIASYPLARPSQEALLPVANGINPAWQAEMATLKAQVLDVEYAGKDAITEEEWKAVLTKIDAYNEWKAAGQKAMDEAIAKQVETHAAAIAPVERLLLYCRDFVKLLHNYVVFKDFYTRSEDSLAIFQAGKLFIDQRQCDLCLRVTDMGKQATMAGLSGIYLIYCHCVSKPTGKEMDIVAAMTAGDVRDMRVGKNALFYDRQGVDYDATVTKIIDNPISVKQAFLSPYRKFGNWVTDKITKSASEKETKQFDQMTSKADSATTELQTKVANEQATPLNPTDAKTAEKKQQMFDIAKFAGIFAAIGLAVGAIGGALAALGGFVTDKWYNIIIIVAAVVILISGPSMLLAWLKLRKRNLGPVLNANGWAINSIVKINTTFGATLTSSAKYPKVVVKDPFADKKAPWWRVCLCWLVVIVIVAGIVLGLMHKLPWQQKAEEPVPTQVENVADTTPTPTIETVAAEEAPAE